MVPGMAVKRLEVLKRTALGIPLLLLLSSLGLYVATIAFVPILLLVWTEFSLERPHRDPITLPRSVDNFARIELSPEDIEPGLRADRHTEWAASEVRSEVVRVPGG